MSVSLEKSTMISNSQTQLLLSGYLDNLKDASLDGIMNTLLKIADETVKSDNREVFNSIRTFVVSNLKSTMDGFIKDKDLSDSLLFVDFTSALLFSHPLFLNMTSDDLNDQELYDWSCEYRHKALLKKDFRFAPKLIVSFTSFPARIDTIYKTLSSIYQQTKLPDKVILWLAIPQFPKLDEELPESLLAYKKLGLDIRWVDEDIRPHKKYYYAMQEFPDDLIVTIDDDLTYDPYMLETLFTSYLHFPHAVSSVRSHLMLQEADGQVASYAKWVKEFSGVVATPSMQLFSTSGAGTLYPPRCMDTEVFNLERIKSLSLNADDLWLKVMQLRKGTPTVLVRENEKLRVVEGTQEHALQNTNVYQDANDTQLKKILDIYDPDGMYLKQVFMDGYSVDSRVSGIDLVSENQYGLLGCNDQSVKIAQQLEKIERELSKIKKSRAYRLSKFIVYIPKKIRSKFRKFRRSGGFKTMLNKFKKNISKE